MGEDRVMEYTSVTNPVWLDSTHKMISAEVVFPELGDTPVKFNACASDVEPHGRAIFADLLADKYGPIAEPAPAT